MAYTNEMRQAIRRLDKPVNIPIHIKRFGKDTYTVAVEKPKLFKILPMGQRQNFISYLEAVANIIESGGNDVEVEYGAILD